jgi:hypothetical protein
MNILIKTTIGLLLLSSCITEDKPKVIYPEKDAKVIQELEKDSTLIEIADLPIHFDSTNYLIHPIGEYKLYQSRGRGSFFSSSSYGSSSFGISRYSGYEISGNLYNLTFEEIDSGKTNQLTDKNIRIRSVKFLHRTFEKTKKKILVYRIIDRDTNQDKKLDGTDISSLYISNIDGSKFTKITKELHELIDWKTITTADRLYFRSISDSNKNGEFDKDDLITYNYINLLSKDWTVKKYNPK